MATESFARLPQHIQKIVTDGLDDEILMGFERISEAQKDQSADPTVISFAEGDIVRVSELRTRLTGEENVV